MVSLEFVSNFSCLHGEAICLVLETRQAPPKKQGLKKLK